MEVHQPSRIRRRAGDVVLVRPNNLKNHPAMHLQRPLIRLSYVQTHSPLQTLVLRHEFQVWKATFYLGCALGCWVVYLMLPKGLRKHYFGAYPRRYIKSTSEMHHAVGQWIYPDKAPEFSFESREESTLLSSRASREHRQTPTTEPNFMSAQSLGSSKFVLSETSRESAGLLSNTRSYPLTLGAGSTKQSSHIANINAQGGLYADISNIFHSGGLKSQSANTGMSTRISTAIGETASRAAPSPRHPAIDTTPSANILAETMRRLKGRGIRLMAHGVQCDPKRVWIKLEEDTASVTWQTEFPRRVPNQSGEVSIVLMRGSLHRIALPNVLYIDVGKKTSALTKVENVNVEDSCCFSLLTQNGSLDLQANSGLERDALVCCMSVTLDQVHERDWRTIYEESSSIVTSTMSSGQFASDMVEI